MADERYVLSLNGTMRAIGIDMLAGVSLFSDLKYGCSKRHTWVCMAVDFKKKGLALFLKDTFSPKNMCALRAKCLRR